MDILYNNKMDILKDVGSVLASWGLILTGNVAQAYMPEIGNHIQLIKPLVVNLDKDYLDLIGNLISTFSNLLASIISLATIVKIGKTYYKKK